MPSQLIFRFVVDDVPMTPRAPKRAIWLVRHGETTWNAMGWVQGQIDGARLTRKGRRQARQVADALAPEPVSAVYSSDLYRARRMAGVTAQRLGCEVRTDHRLRERCFGIAEGLPSVKIAPVVTGIHEGLVVDEHARPPGGESLSEVHERCAAFLEHLCGAGDRGDVVVVAHGGSIRMLRALAADVELRGLAWDTVPNAAIIRLELPLPDLTDARSLTFGRSAGCVGAGHPPDADRRSYVGAGTIPAPFSMAQVDDHLLVDVVMARSVERLGLSSQGHLVAPVVPFGDFGHALQQGEHIVPLDVVADRVLEDLLEGHPMMPVQLDVISHARLPCRSSGRIPHFRV